MSAKPSAKVELLRSDARAGRRRGGEAGRRIGREAIPNLPDRPRAPVIGPSVRRSYPVGRQEFSRAYQGRVFEVSVTSDIAPPESMVLCLDTTLNAPRQNEFATFPFERLDQRTFRCRITPERPGFFWFRARASADGGAAWIRDAAPDAWVMVDPPHMDGLRLYTLIPTASGSIADWTADLARIRDMGFNAVHLLPVTRLDDSQSPYAAKDLFDVDHAYLMDGARGDGLDQFEGFVARAKELGLALCFDLVLNHVGVHSTMARRAPAWIIPDQNSPDGNKRARYWADGVWRTWDDLVLIDYEHPSDVIRAEVWEYMTRYALFWAHYAEETGGLVRFDNLHSSHPEFIRSVSHRLLQEHPSLGTLAEYFTDDVTLLNNVPEWALNLVLATPWGYRFVPDLRRYLRYVHRLSDRVRYFMPITSHDSGSPAQEFGVAESTVPRYVACALLGTGSTGMPQGVEWGAPEKTNFIGIKPRESPPGEPTFSRLIRSVNELLAAHPAFRRGGNCEFVDNEHDSVIAAFRRDPDRPEGGFLVACNFDIHRSQRVTCDLAGVMGRAGRIEGRERLSERQASFDGSVVTLELPPCGATVWELRPA
jgi:Glycogen debranching enzyme, glucanotransferase domain